MDWETNGQIRVLSVTPSVLRDAGLMRLRYRDDSRMSLVDCTTAALLREHGIMEILSGDEHFRLLCPEVRLLPEDDR